ncbi:MAG: ATP synthase F1 subunit gamma [Verrucomicrobia bacterium]|nr:ATP synthase F1 subunit gamma [Verrucomicrobiota bacterium]MDE3098051.1 ATP synthase F1 subunit gamma [Verrucomicrobiota bacterium]
MPSTRDIRRRIRSVKNTAQITKAMQMVAAAKMRKAQQAALVGRPYADLMNRILSEAAPRIVAFKHPLMEVRTPKNRAVILISTDRGLCGALNGNLMREAVKLNNGATTFIAAGKKGAQFVSRTKRRLAAEFTYADPPTFAEARAISKMAQDLFLKGEADAVDILFTNFVSTLVQQPKTVPFLPVAEIKPVTVGVNPPDQPLPAAGQPRTDVFEFEPDEKSVLSALLPHSLTFRVHQILLEARASEHSARMVAMKNASDNAQQLIKDLTLEFNKLRQSNITRELLEITTAQMAVS